jgi:uncharacterized OsmC-like protein
MFENSGLKEIQAPLKERYRTRPSSAMATLRASGTIGGDFTFTGKAGKGCVEAGLAEGAGGSGKDACPGEIFLGALAACAGITLCAVAANMGLGIRAGTVTAEGDLDLRGTMGVSPDVPVGFLRTRVRVALETDADEEQLAALLRLTETYCVVSRSLACPVEMSCTRLPAQSAP